MGRATISSQPNFRQSQNLNELRHRGAAYAGNLIDVARVQSPPMMKSAPRMKSGGAGRRAMVSGGARYKSGTAVDGGVDGEIQRPRTAGKTMHIIDNDKLKE